MDFEYTQAWLLMIINAIPKLAQPLSIITVPGIVMKISCISRYEIVMRSTLNTFTFKENEYPSLCEMYKQISGTPDFK